MARRRYTSRPRSAAERSEPFLFERLEPRLLLSADGLAAPLADSLGADGLDHSTHQELPALDALRPLSLAVDNGGGVPTSAASALAPIDLDTLARLYPALTMDPQSAAHSPVDAHEDAVGHSGRLEVIIVDPRTPDYTTLLQDVANDEARNVQVLVLDTERDGVAQISEFLEQYQGVDALHLVSHGNHSGIQLGASWLGADNVDQYRDALTGWRNALDEDADLLVYGCDSAGSAEGRALLQSLGDLTGTDVASSDDRSGHAFQGGDWDLEYKMGDIETPVAFSATTQQAWKGVLADNTPPTLTGFGSPMGPISEDTEVAITRNDLMAQGDAGDVDGTVEGFVVKSVSSGTLRIGPGFGSATPFAPGTNDTIDVSNKAYWTPSADASGVLDAFQVVARDDGGAESIAPVTVRVTVNGDNDPPTAIALSNATVEMYTDTSTGFTVGHLTATDPDSGDSHSYSILGGADAARFSIANGNELVLTDGMLDFGTPSAYEVTVRVTDSGGLTYDETLTIVVEKILLPLPEATTGMNEPTTRALAPEIFVPAPALALASEIPISVPVDVTARALVVDSGHASSAPPSSTNVTDEEATEENLAEETAAPVGGETTVVPPDNDDRVGGKPEIRINLHTLMSANAMQKSALLVRAANPGLPVVVALSAAPVSLATSPLESDDFLRELEHLRRDVSDEIRVDQTVIASTVAVSAGLSAGYVVWLIRGGVLLSSVLSALPAWRLIDPLPVLAYMKRDTDEDADDDESLESMVASDHSTPDQEPSPEDKDGEPRERA